MPDRGHTEQVWISFHSELLAYVRRQVKTPQDAEDILQSVFVRVFERSDGLGEIENLSGWLYRITRNAIIDHYRSQGSHSEAISRLRGEASADEERSGVVPGPGAEAAKVEVASFLRGLLSELPEEYARAVELADFEGMTQREIADDIGLSLSGAKSRVQRGRAKLREVLLDCCEVTLDRREGVVAWAPREPGSYGCCEAPVERAGSTPPELDRERSSELRATWDDREREVVALGISVAAGCRPCTSYHLRAARQAGATETEITAAVELAASVRSWGARSMLHLGLASKAPKEATPLSPSSGSKELLVAIGAAFVVHCTAQLKVYRDRAASSGIEAERLEALLALAAHIEGQARVHAARAAGVERSPSSSGPPAGRV